MKRLIAFILFLLVVKTVYCQKFYQTDSFLHFGVAFGLNSQLRAMNVNEKTTAKIIIASIFAKEGYDAIAKNPSFADHFTNILIVTGKLSV